MRRVTLHLGSALAVMTAVACQPQVPATLTATDRADIEAVSDSFAMYLNNANYDALAALYTEDAILLPPNQPAVMGQGAIRDWMAAFPPVSDMVLTVLTVEGTGDLAWVYGGYTMTIEGMGADTGKYVEIRHRDADGVWRLRADMFSSNRPPMAP